MLDNLNLTHMNGRVYDQMLGKFLSADPHIAEPLNTQNYNRYAYVNNRPLSYSDPSGFVGEGSFVDFWWFEIFGGGGEWSFCAIGIGPPCEPYDLPTPDETPRAPPPTAPVPSAPAPVPAPVPSSPAPEPVPSAPVPSVPGPSAPGPSNPGLPPSASLPSSSSSAWAGNCDMSPTCEPPAPWEIMPDGIESASWLDPLFMGLELGLERSGTCTGSDCKLMAGVIGAVVIKRPVNAARGAGSAIERGAVSGSQRLQLGNMPANAVRNSPRTVGGRSYSGHAFDQMQNRGITPSVVENAISNGASRAGNTAAEIRYFDSANNVSVVLDRASGRVVTVRYGD